MGTKIHKIKWVDRTQVETREEVEEEQSSYFKGIMTEDNYSREKDIAHITALIPRGVSREDNENLNKPISLQEVEEALSQMAQGKAPGLDGFMTNFFHFFWGLRRKSGS